MALPSCRSVCSIGTALFRLFLAGSILAGPAAAVGQITGVETTVEVRNLPSLRAASHDHTDVLLTSLDTIIHEKNICCGRDSALADAAPAADPNSLQDVAKRLDGRHLIGDGRPIKITTEFLTPDQVGAGHLIAMIEQQHAALMMWNSNLYVVHGVVYIWVTSTAGEVTAEVPVIRRILLWDSRFSDSRREVVFDRGTDDVSKVQGLLCVQWAPQ